MVTATEQQAMVIDADAHVIESERTWDSLDEKRGQLWQS
jgi:hypothetical protein